MPRYTLRIKRSAAKEIGRIARKADRRRVVDRIRALAEDPGSRKLRGDDAHRVRQGDYRILYTIADDVLTVEVVKVGHRRDVYR